MNGGVWPSGPGSKGPAAGHDDVTVAALAGKELSPGGEGRRGGLCRPEQIFDPQIQRETTNTKVREGGGERLSRY